MKFRNIAITQTSIGAAITAIVGGAVTLGFIPAAEQTPILTATTGVVGGVFAAVPAGQVLVGLFIHRKVTPVADPKLDDGTPLIPDPTGGVPELPAVGSLDGPLDVPAVPTSA